QVSSCSETSGGQPAFVVAAASKLVAGTARWRFWMNTIQRRLLRAFLQSGGDLTDAAQVDGLLRCIEGYLVILPPKVRAAVELTWRQADCEPYKLLAPTVGEREGVTPRAATFRQRVSRGARLLAAAIRCGAWP